MKPLHSVNQQDIPENRGGCLPALGTGLGLLSSIPSSIPGMGVWLFVFTFPLMLLGVLLVLASDASTRYKTLASLLLVGVPLACQILYFSYVYH